MKRTIRWTLVVAVLAAAAAGWAVVDFARPYQGYTGAEQFVEIPQGAGPASISRRLVEAGAKGRKSIPEELQSIRAAEFLSLASDPVTAIDNTLAESEPAAPSPRDPATDTAGPVAFSG